MGFVRMVLALIVAMEHAQYGLRSIGGLAAVQVFFTLSGIYMAAVYSAKYGKLPNGQIVFYFNRVLRLWPTYLVLLALTFVVYLVVGADFNDRNLFTLFKAPWSSWTPYITTSAIIFFGQDVFSSTLIAGVDNSFFPVPQSWSVGTELIFYALVPYVCGRRFALWSGIPVFVACVLAKVVVNQKFGWQFSYFFPLLNLGYFSLGSFIYYISQTAIVVHAHNRLRMAWVGPAIIVVLLFFFSYAHLEIALRQHLILMAVLTVLFTLTFSHSFNGIDRFIGNISYSVYLNHFLLIVLLTNFAPALFLHGRAFALTLILSTLALSTITELAIQRPIDRFRSRLTLSRMAKTRESSSSATAG